MALYKYLKKAMRSNSKEAVALNKQRLIQWRKESTPLRIENPTNLLAAKSKGYKNKEGVVLVRVRVNRGQRARPRINKGRRSRHKRQRLVLAKSLQWVAEERAAKKYPNLEVLNSYKLGKDGINAWYEVILVDVNNPNIKADKDLSKLSNQTNRVYRGLTSAAKKSRGLRGKGKGYEKARPSRASNLKRRSKL